MTPFLKWAGGKRWFVHKHTELLPKKFNRYIEPFLGGGSMFFHIKPQHALLGDANPDVISAYKAIKDDWKNLVQQLEIHQINHSDQYYYQIRAKTPNCLVEQASRMIYLNRTCFNGIYRVNRNGLFNVPRGSKNSVILPTDDFESMANLLASADIRCSDFQKLIDEAQEGDLIFADPPYTVRHNLNGFVKYNEKLFSWSDQERLAESLLRAKDRGAQIVMTNANHASVRELYQDKDFKFLTVSRASSISASTKSRKRFEELVILSHSS
ncbi:Dam family site-specific DNA-(adenine-N6)-methyltransferase [Methylobacter sp. BlB1]|uniref:DNA adenine methylase n=1 Tax=Methylobacter sp. BlB1 TaxID=2785914 RepID=UPI001895DFF2|nr:Dam family site-specific DNA-(adenine-N6)-methyltransferase [Methylobacter sp. BlB1]MBF6650209.1 Dam family site-specific DNA-(adenine-N6)-methyltransferase [Methylobacter sp. BlB1]